MYGRSTHPTMLLKEIWITNKKLSKHISTRFTQLLHRKSIKSYWLGITVNIIRVLGATSIGVLKVHVVMFVSEGKKA
jgi:L-rhamnose isomerase